MGFNSGFNTIHGGTGFMVKKEIRDSVVDFVPISDRKCKLRVRGKYRKISIINVHAPTKKEEEEKDKDSFYEQVAGALAKIPRYDVKILI